MFGATSHEEVQCRPAKRRSEKGKHFQLQKGLRKFTSGQTVDELVGAAAQRWHASIIFR